MSAGTLGYRAIASVAQLSPVNIGELFKPPSSEAVISPIDSFIRNTDKLNKLYVSYISDPADWMPELGSLVLLGYMSAIESYVRALVTGLVNIDAPSRRQAGAKTISFAIATSHPNPKLLPEALMENMAFSSSGTIEKALREILGISKISDDLRATIAEFEKLCQVRHCCVHRFGKLGSQNAMELGFDAHRAAIEYPFTPTPSDVEQIADVLQGTVRTLNNFIFREVLDRTSMFEFDNTSTWFWAWHYGKDRRRFQCYYDLFALTGVQPRSAAPKLVYESFRTEHLARVNARRQRRR